MTMRISHRLALVLALVSVTVLAALDLSAQTTRPSVTGTVKTATEGGLVVVGLEPGNTQREWVFAVDDRTRIEAGGQTRPVTALKSGDSVTVTYDDRGGKVIAERVTVNPQR
jgi:hypothetical protein